jgi:formylglycine-generating enzyme required for sulfatase activity
MGIPQSEAMEATKEFASLGVLEEWILKECPEILVALDAYSIAKYPVTNADYKFYLDQNQKAETPPYWKYKIYPSHLANHPAHSLSLEAIDEYIAWLNKTTNSAFRLPTEAEWEFAAKGRDRVIYPWGNTYEKDHANTVESGLINTTPIGLFPNGMSHCGCLDMAGNVEEYTASYYAPYDKNQIIMDDLLESGPYLIARGGSYTRFRDLARTTRRHGKYDSDLYIMGFRLAKDLP